MRFGRNRREHELNREIESHLHLESEAQKEAGACEHDASLAARRAFGNTTLVKEEVRDMWGSTALDRLWQDLRYALRTLRKTPGFTMAAVLSLALGIGANTAIFSLVNAVILRLLPVREPRQLVQLTYTGPGDWNSFFGYPQLERFRAEAKTLSDIFGGVGLGRVNVAFRDTADLARGDAYTDNFFTTLGVTPQHGRLFAAGDDKTASTAVLSDGYWRRRFGADPGIIGGTVTINQVPFTVIGVTPPEFTGVSLGSAPDLWVPLHALERFNPDKKRWEASFTSWLLIAGRLRPDVSRAEAQAELDVIHRRLLAEQLSAVEQPGDGMRRFVRESRLVLRPAESGLFSGLRERYAFPLRLLMWVAGAVLLIACANVANLLLARASNRRREIAVRLALGAKRSRVVRQLLTESILLASMGGALALAIAWSGSAALIAMISTGDSILPLDVRPDWRVFGFASAVSLATGILFGLAPALRGTRVDPGPTLKEGARYVTRSSGKLDRLLVVTQIALSVVLITGAGLFVRTLQNLWNTDMGYSRDNVLMFSVNAKLAGYERDRAAVMYSEILRRLQSLRDVRSASLSVVRPVDDQMYLVNRVGEVDGRKLPERDSIRVATNSISQGYFATLAIPILLGRDFEMRDNHAVAKVAIVNESLAERALPGQNPIGHRLGDATIIGVVKDSRYGGAREQPRPVLYESIFQSDLGMDVSVEVRSRDGAGILEEARREVAAVDRSLPIFRIKTLRAQTADSLLRERLLAMVSTFFGALALLLACVGLYGLMAYAVARRTGEIGIRMALGARREHITWQVLRETLLLALAGVAIGVPLTLWTAQFAKALLFGVTTTDPLTIGVSIAMLLAVAAIAAYLSARRAFRVDPMVALRHD